MESYLLYLWVSVFLFNHLIFKHALLKMLKVKHLNIWREMGSPSIISFKESHWPLLGLSGKLNIKNLIIKDNGDRHSISLLNRYRWSSYFEVLILILVAIAYVQRTIT